MFRRGSRTKPSFATVTGRGDNPRYIPCFHHSKARMQVYIFVYINCLHLFTYIHSLLENRERAQFDSDNFWFGDGPHPILKWPGWLCRFFDEGRM